MFIVFAQSCIGQELLQPKIPLAAAELYDMLLDTNLGNTSNSRLQVESKCCNILF